MEAPPKFKVPVAPLVNVLAPASVVETVSVPLLVVVPLMVKDGIEITFVPLIVLAVPLKVCTPVPPVNVPLFCKLPPNANTAAAVSFQVPPLFTVTSPVKVFVPTALLNVIVPLKEVAPETVRVKAPTVSVDPLAIFSVAHAAAAPTVTVKLFSINTISPAIGAEAPEAPPDEADHVEVEAQVPEATE